MRLVQTGQPATFNDGEPSQPEIGHCGNHKEHGSKAQLADVYHRAIRGSLLSQLSHHIEAYSGDEAHFLGMVQAGKALLKGCPDAIVADILADLLIEQMDALAAQPKAAADPWRLVDPDSVRKSYQRVCDYQPRAREDVPVKEQLTAGFLLKHSCPANPDGHCIGTECPAFRRSRVPLEHQPGRALHEINCSHEGATHRGTMCYVNGLTVQQIRTIPEYKKYWPPVRVERTAAPAHVPSPPVPAAPAVPPMFTPPEREHDTKPERAECLSNIGEDSDLPGELASDETLVVDPDVCGDSEPASSEQQDLVEQAAATGCGVPRFYEHEARPVGASAPTASAE